MPSSASARSGPGRESLERVFGAVVARGSQASMRVLARASVRERFSAHGEDAVIAALLDLVPRIDRSCVDLAASDGVNLSNTIGLYRAGWGGVAFEADPALFAHLAATHRRSPQVALVRAFVDPTNVVELLRAHGVPREFGFFNLDIDGYDHDVLATVLEQYRPTIVCTEINEIIPPPVRFAVRFRDDYRYAGDGFFGHSLAQAERLASEHGYDLVAVHFNNAFFVPSEHGLPRLDAAEAFRNGYAEHPERAERFGYNAPFEDLLTADPESVVARLRELFRDRDPESFLLEH